MTREEKIKRFDVLCHKHDGCGDCPINQRSICDFSATEKFTDKQLDYGIVLLSETEKNANPGQHEFDVVERPKHYTKTSIECIDAMIETQGVEAVKAFCVCNAFKYLWRHNSKNGDEDIKKANWYLNKAVELMKGGQHEN